MSLTAWVCETCGTQYPPSTQAPATCPICVDCRQWVPHSGQQWTTLEKLRSRSRNTWHLEEPGVFAIRTEPAFGIGQCAFLLQTDSGNFLWDCISLIDEATIALIQSLGGLKGIAISHPHYYTSMAEWSTSFGGVPVYIHEAERKWVQRPEANVVYWSGDVQPLAPELTLIRCGGHFEGYQVLHWTKAAEGRGAVFAGDQPQVTPGRDWVSFLWSYPNMVPLGKAEVDGIDSALEPHSYDRIYGAFGRHILSDAKQVVRRSADRYRAALQSKYDFGDRR